MDEQKIIQLDLSKKIIRIEFNEGWYPTEMSSVLFWINTFYNVRLLSYALSVELGRGSFPYYIIPYDYIRENQASRSNITAILDNYFQQKKIKELDVAAVNTVTERFKSQYKLHLKRINYNSPGSFDGLGIGKIIEEVKDFFLRTKQFNFEKQKYSDAQVMRDLKKYREIEELKAFISATEHTEKISKLETLKQIEEIKEQKLKNIETFIHLAEKLDIPIEQLKNQVYTGLNEILKLEESNQINSIQVVDEDE